jgi:transposase
VWGGANGWYRSIAPGRSREPSGCNATRLRKPFPSPDLNSVEFTERLDSGVNRSRCVEGQGRRRVTLLPVRLGDFIAEDNTVRIVDVFINELDLVGSGFDGAEPALAGRPSYHPAVLLKLYLCGYLNRIQASCTAERECQRNVELMWLTGSVAPDFKTIADFRRDNGKGLRNV